MLEDNDGYHEWLYKDFQYDPAWMAQRNDNLRPFADYIKYPPATIRLGENLHFETKLFDSSGIKSAKVTFTKATGLNFIDEDEYFDDYYSSITLDLKYNSIKGVWETDYLLPLNGPTGLFVVNLIAVDNAGNQLNIIFDWELDAYPRTMVILPALESEPENPGETQAQPENPVKPPGSTGTAESTPPANTKMNAAGPNELPDTAAIHFNLLLAGLSLMVAGGAGFFIRKKTAK